MDLIFAMDSLSIGLVCGKDVNIIWKHGIRKIEEENYINKGRYSIIAWGWKEMKD